MEDMTLRAVLCQILNNQVALGDMLARAREESREHLQDCANRIGYLSEPLIRALGGSGSSLLATPPSQREQQT